VIEHEIPMLSGEDANDFALWVITGKGMRFGDTDEQSRYQVKTGAKST
jgi:hypothetical protein